jgi:hypothetical protein
VKRTPQYLAQLRSWPCLDGSWHKAVAVTTLDGSEVGRWVCPDCLMRVSRRGQPMLDDGTSVPLLPDPGVTTNRYRTRRKP